MKKSIFTRLFALLCLVLIWGATAWADDNVSTHSAGTEKWQVTNSTKINKQDSEYTYYASANISILVGAKEIWEEPKLIDNNYYLRSQGNPGILSSDGKGQTDAIYDINSKKQLIPNTGNYFHFLFHTKGTIKMAFAIKYANSTKKNLFIAKPTTTNYTYNYKKKLYPTVIGLNDISAKIESSNADSKIELDNNGYYKITADAGWSFYTITFNAEAGEDYCVWMNSAEEFALGGFEFTVDPSYIFTPWSPYVHEQVELGKDPSTTDGINSGAPTGVKDITFMYGGWLNHPNAVKAATWNEDDKKWSMTDNGTENNQYSNNETTYTDEWAVAKKESETSENLITLDGYEYFTAGCGNNPTNEHKENYSPLDKPSVMAVPCRGTYYKFEPHKDGFLTVYVRQSNSNNPLYLVDEGGIPQESVDNVAGQTGVTITEGENYSYTTSALSACRYSFNVKAGKTYVLFQNNESLGFYGFTFGANETPSTDITMKQSEGFEWNKEIDNANITLVQKLKSEQWNAICLPFSMTEKQVRETFGADSQISEFKNIDNSKVNFSKHYYQLITAGKPCLIFPKGGKVTPSNITLGENEYYVSGVTISAEKPFEISDPNNHGFSFVGTYTTEAMPANSHFIGANDGKLYYITKEKNIGGLKSYLKADNSAPLNAKLFANFEEDNTVTGIENLISNESHQKTNSFVYNLNGQIVGTATQTSKLNKGIYIINGKKYIIK